MGQLAALEADRIISAPRPEDSSGCSLGCSSVYIGETGRTLAERVREHRYLVGKVGKSAVADHILQTNHAVDFDNAKILIAEPDIISRKLYEALLIKNSRTFENNKQSCALNLFK